MNETEIEAKLAIRSPDPEGTLCAMAALREVGGFRLRPASTHRIRDIYLQLPDAHIHEGPHGPLALRRRTVTEDALAGGAVSRALLTLKGSPSADPGIGASSGVTRRLEIEVPDDEAGWNRVKRALRSAGVPVDGALEELMPLQVRETHRIRRAVEPMEGEGAPVADLTLDTVDLVVRGHRVRFREVEVEALPGVSDPVGLLRRLQEALRGVVGPDILVPWRLSKLETGLELERLAMAGDLAGLVSPAGDLLPRGHDRIQGAA